MRYSGKACLLTKPNGVCLFALLAFTLFTFLLLHVRPFKDFSGGLANNYPLNHLACFDGACQPCFGIRRLAPDDNRYLQGLLVTGFADALAELMGSDPCVGRPAQFMILPTIIKSTDEHYQHMIAEGEALSPSAPFWLNAAALAEQHQAAAAKVSQRFNQAAPKPFNEKLVGRQVSIIECVNASYEWPELLAHYGYKRKGRNAWMAPESTSGTAGVHILTSSTDGKERIFSHHQSDPAGNRLCDKFDLITIRNFSGDSFKAVQEIAKEQFPDIHAHNRREWARAQRDEQRQRFEAMREGTKPLAVAKGQAKAISQPKGVMFPLLSADQMAEIMEAAQ